MVMQAAIRTSESAAFCKKGYSESQARLGEGQSSQTCKWALLCWGLLSNTDSCCEFSLGTTGWQNHPVICMKTSSGTTCQPSKDTCGHHVAVALSQFWEPCTVAPLGQSAALALGWLSNVEGTLLESTLTCELSANKALLCASTIKIYQASSNMGRWTTQKQSEALETGWDRESVSFQHKKIHMPFLKPAHLRGHWNLFGQH